MIPDNYAEQLDNLETSFAIIVVEMRLKPVEETVQGLMDVIQGIHSVIVELTTE